MEKEKNLLRDHYCAPYIEVINVIIEQNILASGSGDLASGSGDLGDMDMPGEFW